MPRCPYLSLGEEGTTPFPFSSSSHRCYVSEKRLPIGQREQERYCLTRRYTSCPLFLSQSIQEGLADELSEAVVEEKPEVVAEPPLKETVQPLPIREALVDDSLKAVIEERPEVVVEPLPKETVEPLPIQEALVDESLKEVMEEKPEVVVEPLSAQESPADKVAEAVVEREKPSIAVAPLRGELQQMGPGPMSILFKRLPWVAAGVAFLTLLCVTGVAIYRVLSRPVEIALPSFTLSSLWPGALLLVSAISFAGAVSLAGLFLLTRRLSPK